MSDAFSLNAYLWPSPNSAPLALHLLGVPRILHLGQPAKLPRSQTRALLYRLGTKLEPISRDELIALFWPELDEGTARLNFRRLLSFVRRDLPDPDALVATSDSVSLDPQLVWSDTDAIQHLKHVDTVNGWIAAADLYGGPFLSGFYLRNCVDYELWQSTTMHRLREDCLEALAKLIDHTANRGDIERATEYARRYLEINNLQETIHQKLISFYVQMGKRDLAVRQFEECVLILERELGVEPFPETRAAYEQALQNPSTPSVMAKLVCAPTFFLLPTLELPLIGRESALDQLAKAYARLRNGGLIVVSGESGVGKTRLVQAFTEQMSALVLTGHCYMGAEVLPYYPILEMVRQASASPEFEQSVSKVSMVALLDLMPELAVHFPTRLEPTRSDAPYGQQRLYEAIVQLVLTLAEKQQVILYFDDIQWADSTTIEWLLYASSRFGASRICVLASTTDIHTASLEPLVKAMGRAGKAVEVHLDGLSIEAVLATLRAVKVPEPNDSLTARQLHRAAGGNTFYVLELMRELMEADRLGALPSPLPVPQTLQSIVDSRISRLSPIAIQVLEAAAVLEPELEFEVLQETTGRNETEVSDGLEELVVHRLLYYTGGRLHFQHNIVREAVYGSLRVWRRHLLHQRAGNALIRLGAKRGDNLSIAVADHFAAAGNSSSALQHYYTACLTAQRNSSARLAVQYAQNAIALIGSATPPDTAASVYEALGDSLSLLGHFAAAQEAFHGAAHRLATVNSLQSIGLLTKSAAVLVLCAEYGDATVRLQQALAQLIKLPQPHEAAWWQGWIDARLQQARISWFQGEVLTLAEAIQELTPRISEYGTLRQQRMLVELVQWNQGVQSASAQTEALVASRYRALEDAIAHGYPLDIVSARLEYGDALLWNRRWAEANKVLAAAYKEADTLDLTVLRLECASRLLIAYRLAGQIELVEALCPEASALAHAIGMPLHEGVVKAQEAWLLLRHGEQATAYAFATQALAIWEKQRFPMRWLAQWIMLAVQLSVGQVADAVQSAWYMLEGNEQAHNPEVVAVLSYAVDSWTLDAVQQTVEFLRKVVELGYLHGYL